MPVSRRRLLAAALVALVALTVLPRLDANSASARTVVTYRENPATFANPYRGFYHGAETSYVDARGTGYEPLDAATLRSWRRQGISQVLREWVLPYNGGADGAWSLTADLLRRIDRDLAIARRAGVSVIVRFEYVGDPGPGWPPPTPYGDAPVARVLHHIDQLGPVLRRNADVIATVQQGFIGLWGEGYYTDHFADPDDPSQVSARNWADRERVLKALLRELPRGVTVSVRTPQTKQQAFDRPTGRAGALTPRGAYSGSMLARTGHHNDCFLASADDYGTYVSDPITADQTYLAADSRYVPVGGETCNPNAPRSAWSNARAQLTRFHWSYLNLEYHPDVLASWGAAGRKEVADRLGYRFVLRRTSVVPTVRRGARLHATVDVVNVGFAAPYRRSTVQLVLTDGHRTYRLTTAADPRRWAPGETSRVRFATPVPESVRPGSYRLALAMPSRPGAPPAFAVRTANLGTWNPVQGWNRLDVRVTVR